ncbi:hypothetical protein FKM82_022949 [Ascaphus truei]
MKQLIKDPSGIPSRYATCEWFYQSPLKPADKSASDVALPPTSQIPGLSDLAEPHNELMGESRRKWIRDTDSDYVKLAKQGGQPDLLKQMTPASKETSSGLYSLPDWYSDESLIPPAEDPAVPLRNMPDYMFHEACPSEQLENRYEMRKGPFDFDQKTVWQRESEDNEKENHREVKGKKVKLPAIKQKFPNDKNTDVPGKGPNATTAKEENLGKKCFFPPMPVSRNNEPVNFSKLMSNGYGDDWFQQRGDLEKKSLQKTKHSEKFKDAALSEYTKRKGQRQINELHKRKINARVEDKRRSRLGPVAGIQPEKPLFKLRIFRDLPARVESHRKTVKVSAT